MTSPRNGTFQHELELLSRETSTNHLYPRPDLMSLDQYLQSSTTKRPTSSDAPGGDLTSNFLVIHNLANGMQTCFGSSQTDLAAFASSNANGATSILFIRGYASPEWLKAIGEKYGVSPELYRRHLEHGAYNSGGRNWYSSPPLPSSSTRVFQLNIPTICTRNVPESGYEAEDLQKARSHEKEALKQYFIQLRNRAKVADSIVRNCLLLSKGEYVIEQTISIEVGQPDDDWQAIVWLDNGRDLSQSIGGPWCPRPGTRSWETYFYPIIVQQSAKHIRRPSATDDSTPSVTAIGAKTTEWRGSQNICLLPFQYGAHLDRPAACQDAVYALSEIFRFSAAAETQFLNFLHSRIEHELSFIGREGMSQYHTTSLLNLRYIKEQIFCHTERLLETITVLRTRTSSERPQAELSTEAALSISLLITDFEFLQRRADDLAQECEKGMATLANSSMLEEAKRSANMALRVQRLTVIATLFIPLSFVCSMWGMNFREMGSGSLSVWVWFISAAPVLVLSQLLYSWESIVRKSRNITRKSKNRHEGSHE